MSTFVFPSNYDLFLVQQEKSPVMEKDRELLKRFPVRYTNHAQVKWEQYDSHYGVMSVRGINGKPGVIQALPFNQFSMKPGYYGNVRIWDEMQQTQLRQPGTPNERLDLRAEMAREQERLMGMRLDLMELTLSEVLRLGRVMHRAEDGTLLHTDTIGINTLYTPGTPWSTLATATPLKDLRALKVTAQTGTSAKFGKNSEILANATTINYLLNNANAADIGGKRLEIGKTVLGIDDLNEILAANDIGKLVEYDEQYRTAPTTLGGAPGSWTRFIPDGYLIWLGSRPAGQVIGEFQATFNAQEDALAEEGVFKNSGRTGIYTRVIDTGIMSVPREIQLHHGMNGGVAIYYPTAVQPLYVI